MKRILVFGLGRSGLGLLDYLAPLLPEIWVADDAPFSTDELSNKYGTKISAYTPETAVDLALLSPGIPPSHPLIGQLRSEGVVLQSELDFAAEQLQGDILAVTGTNGKSTTTAWCAHILGVPAAGNIGVSISSLLRERARESLHVLEVSSFQLEFARTLRPRAAAILNITPDHVLWHGGMDAYIAAKKKICARMEKDDSLLLGADSPILMEAAKELKGPFAVRTFSIREEVERGAFLRGSGLWLREEEDCFLLESGELSLRGDHNIANALAAASLCCTCGAPIEQIRAGLRSFPGLPHRYEVLGRAHGRRFINDSKATNPESTLPALGSVSAPTILLLGGLDKGIEYDALFEEPRPLIKAIVCYGESAQKIMDCAGRLGVGRIHRESDLEGAAARAWELSEEGDDILLSPASASWDAYPSFEARGDHFREIFERLKK